MDEDVNRSFNLFTEQRKYTEKMTLEQKGKLLEAIFVFLSGGQPKIEDPFVEVVFMVLADNQRRIDDFRAKQKTNGSLGGRPKSNPEKPKETQNNPEKPKENPNETERKPKKAIDIGIGIDKDIKDNKEIYSSNFEPVEQKKQACLTPFEQKSQLVIEGVKSKLYGEDAENFLRFWDVFGLKEGKRQAVDAWAKIKNKTPELIERIIAGAEWEAYKRPGKIANGQTPKMAQGWLNDCRWEDIEDEKAQMLIQNPCPHDEIKKAYNTILPGLQAMKDWNPLRRRNLDELWIHCLEEKKFSNIQEGVAYFRRYFEYVGQSRVLMGQEPDTKGKYMTVDFSWLINRTNYTSIIENKFFSRRVA